MTNVEYAWTQAVTLTSGHVHMLGHMDAEKSFGVLKQGSYQN